ncbi:hypothetical protein TSMEX_005101 [Taenia solium]|eukprot:TsM_001072700 transcript=TsM_001072700 gene=TsM_001072700
MRSHSGLISLFLLLAFVSHCVPAAVMLGGEAERKLEEELFEVSDALEDEEVTQTGEEEELVEVPDEADGRVDVLVPAGWGSFRRRISGAFRRVGGAFRRIGDGIRRAFRGPWKICVPKCPEGGRRPGPWTA